MIRALKFLMNFLVKLFLLAVVLAGVAGMIWGPQEMLNLFMKKQDVQKTASSETTFFKCRRDRLKIGLTERGSLRATKTVGIFHTQSRVMKFKWIEEEGKLVKKEDVIARFETEEFEEKITEQEKNLNQFLEDLEVAKKEIGITESSGNLEVARAETELLDAKENLKKHKQLDAPKKLKELSDAKLAARKEVEKVTTTLAEKQAVIDDQLYTGDEGLENALKELSNAKEEVKKMKQKEKDASLNKKLYQTYDYKKELRNKEEAVANATLSLSKAKISAKNQLAQKKAHIRKIEDNIERTKKEIQELKTILVSCEVKAPVDGRLLYGDPERGWPNPSDVAVGKEMWNDYNFLTIPDESSFVVDTWIVEEYRHKIKEGLEAKITLEAMPELKFDGKITQIESFAKENRGGLKTYKTQVTLNASDSHMVSGMSVSVEIIAEILEDTLVVPIEAVFSEENQTVCYVRTAQGTEKRTVKVGKSNDHFAQILEGLTESEEASLINQELNHSSKTPSEKQETPSSETQLSKGGS